MPQSAVIVDDDPAFLGLAARIVSALGIDVVATVADASQAVAAVWAHQPGAVLVDMGLPDRSGIDLAYELLELSWQPRVVLTSSDSDAFLAIFPRQGHRTPPFLAKDELDSETLRAAFGAE